MNTRTKSLFLLNVLLVAGLVLVFLVVGKKSERFSTPPINPPQGFLPAPPPPPGGAPPPPPGGAPPPPGGAPPPPGGAPPPPPPPGGAPPPPGPPPPGPPPPGPPHHGFPPPPPPHHSYPSYSYGGSSWTSPWNWTPSLWYDIAPVERVYVKEVEQKTPSMTPVLGFVLLGVAAVLASRI